MRKFLIFLVALLPSSVAYAGGDGVPVVGGFGVKLQGLGEHIGNPLLFNQIGLGFTGDKFNGRFQLAEGYVPGTPLKITMLDLNESRDYSRFDMFKFGVGFGGKGENYLRVGPTKDNMDKMHGDMMIGWGSYKLRDSKNNGFLAGTSAKRFGMELNLEVTHGDQRGVNFFSINGGPLRKFGKDGWTYPELHGSNVNVTFGVQREVGQTRQVAFRGEFIYDRTRVMKTDANTGVETEFLKTGSLTAQGTLVVRLKSRSAQGR